jgi:hypothetical protein
MSEFITITEAIKITGKSKSTIRRFVLAHSDNDTIIKKDNNARNRPLYKINKAFILSYFSISKSNSNCSDTTYQDNNIEFDKKLLLMHEKLNNQAKQFKVIIISLIVVFIVLFGFGIYYHYRIVTKLDEELNFYINYQSANQKTYDISKKELKVAYRNLLDEKQKKIDSLESAIKKLETSSTITAKQIDTLEKDKDKLINKLTGTKLVK